VRRLRKGADINGRYGLNDFFCAEQMRHCGNDIITVAPYIYIYKDNESTWWENRREKNQKKNRFSILKNREVEIRSEDAR
jgi:hypothetical protein